MSDVAGLKLSQKLSHPFEGSVSGVDMKGVDPVIICSKDAREIRIDQRLLDPTMGSTAI
jgi:hypothetical protein